MFSRSPNGRLRSACEKTCWRVRADLASEHDDRWGGTWTQRRITRGGGENTLAEREYVEGGHRKLAREKLSAMDDDSRFRPAF